MTDVVGFVVLARHPNPYTETGWDYTVIGPPFANADDAERACQWVAAGPINRHMGWQPGHADVVAPTPPDGHEYVVGTLSLHESVKVPLRDMELCVRCGQPGECGEKQ